MFHSLVELVARRLSERAHMWGWLAATDRASGLAPAFFTLSELGKKLRNALAKNCSGDLGGVTVRSAGTFCSARLFSQSSRGPGWGFLGIGESKGPSGFSTCPLPQFSGPFLDCPAMGPGFTLSGMASFQSSKLFFCSSVSNNFFRPVFFPAVGSGPLSSPTLPSVLQFPGSCFSLAWGGSLSQRLSSTLVGCWAP